jgi:thiol peroxidase
MERTGIVTMKGNPVTLVGPEIKPGDAVLDAKLAPVTLKDYAGKVVLLSVAPSLDTPVCDLQAHRFNDEAAALGSGVAVLNISMDLPFAINRFCLTGNIENMRVLSDHRDASFGTSWGVLIKELRLLARAVFVVDGSGTVRYAEIVPEVTSHPDYDKAIQATRSLSA